MGVCALAHPGRERAPSSTASREAARYRIAYILTRPLGASLGDLLSQTKANGGLGLGTVVTSVAFLVVIVVLVIFRSHGLNDSQRPAPAPDGRTG